MKKFITWLPRILTITFILFISLFSLDAFSEPNSFWINLIGFFIHLTPSFILLIILLISWKRKLIGGISFIALAIIFTFAFHTYEDIVTLLLISLPPLLIGILYLIDYKKTK
jgi:hypothetical protein